MCRVKIYIKQCPTCQTPLKDRYSHNQVYVEQHPCPYVLSHRMPLGGCQQRTQQERCGGMDWMECEQCIEDAWLRYGESRAYSSDEDEDEDDENGGGYGMGKKGSGDAGGFGGDGKKNDRDGPGEGGSGLGDKDNRGEQAISTRS